MFTPTKHLCPFCGGKRKTLYVYPSNSYYCHRCKKSGNIAELNIPLEVVVERKVYNPRKFNNVLSSRFSLVRGREFDGRVDTFEVKLPNGKQIGYHSRYPGKKSITQGERGLGYRERFLKLDKVYRVVEGPYDVIYPEDVCTFGIPSRNQAKLLRPYKLILCPDGDMWKRKDTLFAWLRPFMYNQIVWVEKLPLDKDPDEIPKGKREVIDWNIIRPHLGE